jgi:hypothetical protein
VTTGPARTLAAADLAAVDLDALLDDIRSGLGRAVACADRIGCGVETVLGGLPGGAGADVADLRSSVAAVDAQFATMLAAAGDPAGLRATGTRWLDQVSGPVSRLVGIASVNVTEADDHWTGAAADAYRGTLLAQQAALTAIVATAQDVDTALDDLAAAITRFWIAIGSACLAMVVALAGALVAAGTLAGAPVAAAAALTGVAALIASGNAALSSLTDVTLDAAARGAALERRLADGSAFPFGSWPRSTTDISTDAQVTDGDGSDWLPR